MQETAEKVYIDGAIKNYIAQINMVTRFASKYIEPTLASYINLGASTRGAIAFMEASKALALINGRDHVIPEDIKELRYSVSRHRISLNFSAIADDVPVERIIDALCAVVANIMFSLYIRRLGCNPVEPVEV